MRHLLSAPIAALSFIGLVQVASAADLPRKAPAAVPVAYNWTGFYIGANVGGGWGSRSVDYVANNAGPAAFFDNAGTPNPSFKTSGALGGVQFGYNWQIAPAWVAGLEADFDWAGLKGSGASNHLVNGGLPFSAPAEERIKWFGTARARLGYLPANNLLAYVTGGFAYGRVERSASYINNQPVTVVGPGLICPGNATCLAGSSSKVAAGWTVGGGFEYAFMPKWTLKAEYLYVSLGGNSVLETSPVSPAASTTANFGRAAFNVARVGVNYRF